MLRPLRIALYGAAAGLEGLALRDVFADGDPTLAWGCFAMGLAAWACAGMTGAVISRRTTRAA